MPAMRILFLHGLQSTPLSPKCQTLRELYGDKCVCAPNLRTRMALILAILCLVVLIFMFIAPIVLFFCFLQIWAGIIAIPVFLVVLWLFVSFGGRGLCGAMTRRAASIADEAFADFRPNIIVATSFGAVVAFHMSSPKVPMLLFTPAHAAYSRYMKSTRSFSVSAFPYIIIVHPSNDKVIPLDDSIQLVETSFLGRTRLEVIEDDHKLKTLTKDDIRAFVDEVYARGRAEVLSRPEEDDFDPSLFHDESPVENERLLPP